MRNENASSERKRNDVRFLTGKGELVHVFFKLLWYLDFFDT